MSDESPSFTEIDIFKEALLDENLSVQIDTIKKLPALAQILGPEKTREEIIPFIDNGLDIMHEELLYNLAGQLEKLVDLIGGVEFINIILSMLIRISLIDETLVRDRAVTSMKNIGDRLSNQQCEQTFYPLIDELVKDKNEWHSSKCSATSLFSICYPKVSKEKQEELLNMFRNIIQDESPLVRRSAESSLVDFIQVLNSEIVKSEFIPVFDNLAIDDQDSVKVLAVDVGIAIAKKMKDYEIHEFLLNTFENLCKDASWRVRQRVAFKIDEIETVCGRKNSCEILTLYSNCVRDQEQEVRTVAADNLYKFCVTFKENFNGEDFEKYFTENLMSAIHHMFTDESEEVRLALSSNILSLSAILSNDCFNLNILPLVVDSLENEESMTFKENMLKNLNSLPKDVDIKKSFKSITKVIKNLLENSQLHWRTRRNLLLAFMHIVKYSTREFFDDNLRIFYLHLLNDPVYAIRRVSPVILPLLIKQFGVNWARNTLIPIFATFSKDNRYLYKYITLYGIEELIAPTLDKTFKEDDKCKYLTSLSEIIENSGDNKIYIEVLARIVKLHEKLSNELNLIENLPSENNYVNDKLKLYGEDTLENLKKQSKNIFVIDKSELGDNICYLEGVLIVLLKEFIKTVKNMLGDPVENVRHRTEATLRKIGSFVESLRDEIEASWVNDKLEKLSDEDLKRINVELDEILAVNGSLTEEILDSDFIDDMVIDDSQNEALPDLGAEVLESEVNNNNNNNTEQNIENANTDIDIKENAEKVEEMETAELKQE